MTKNELYGNLPPVRAKIAMLRLRLAGHCVRHPEERASKLVLWELLQGKAGRGRKPIDYIDVIRRDTGLEEVRDIRNVMMDRNLWKDIVNHARSGDRPN